jgi:hypothetical protein
VNYAFQVIFNTIFAERLATMTIKPSKCTLKQVVKNVKKKRHSRFGGKKWRENVN